MEYLETSNILNNLDPSNKNFVYNRTMTFKMTSKKIRPSEHRQFHIKFEFLFKSEHVNVVDQSSDDSTELLYRQDIANDDTASITVVVDKSSSLLVDHIVLAFHEAIGDRLSDDDRVVLVCRAAEEIDKSIPNENPPRVVLEGETLPQFHSLYMCFEIWTVHLRIHAVSLDSAYSIRPLEKREAVRSNDEEEKRCCEERRMCSICLEELRGCSCRGGEMRMPCSHLFHGDCIKVWLTTRNCCPLCRYEMPAPAPAPTQERQRQRGIFFKISNHIKVKVLQCFLKILELAC